MYEGIYRSLDSIGLFTDQASVFSSLCPYINQGLLISTLKMEAETASETLVLRIKLSGDTCQKTKFRPM